MALGPSIRIGRVRLRLGTLAGFTSERSQVVYLTPHEHAALYRVYIDEVWVGLSDRRECEALADELRADPDMAEWVKGVMAD